MSPASEHMLWVLIRIPQGGDSNEHPKHLFFGRTSNIYPLNYYQIFALSGTLILKALYIKENIKIKVYELWEERNEMGFDVLKEKKTTIKMCCYHNNDVDLGMHRMIKSLSVYASNRKGWPRVLEKKNLLVSMHKRIRIVIISHYTAFHCGFHCFSHGSAHNR